MNYHSPSISIAQSPPFVGRMMRLENAPESRRPVINRSPHFPVCKEFQGASYLKRYDVLCQRLVQEKLYTSAALLTSPRTASATGDYTEPSEMTDLRAFVAARVGHAAAEAIR